VETIQYGIVSGDAKKPAESAPARLSKLTLFDQRRCRYAPLQNLGDRLSGLRIYGIARTRAFRALWMANELGLDYEHLPIEIDAAGARSLVTIRF
jgi:hypothetical protein